MSDLMRLVFCLCVAVTTISLGSGCDNGKPGKERIIEGTRKSLCLDLAEYEREQNREKSQTEYQQFPESVWEEGKIYQKYYVERMHEAIHFLEGKPSLERPYMIRGFLDLDAHFAGGWPYEVGYRMFVEWLEYDTHAVGVVLAETNPNGRRWRLPVFAKEDWAATEGTMWRLTASRVRGIRAISEEIAEPLVRDAPIENESQLPAVLVIPKTLTKARLAVGVYDEKGDESNLVPLFIPFSPHE